MKSLSLVLLLLACCMALTACDEKPTPVAPNLALPSVTPSGPTNEERAAYAAACDAVLSELKTPATAHFSPPENAMITHRPDDTWQIYGSVDAQNFNGALVRYTWGLRMEYDATLKRAVNVTDYWIH